MEQTQSNSQHTNSLSEHESGHDSIYLFKKGSLLPPNVKQTNIEQKSD